MKKLSIMLAAAFCLLCQAKAGDGITLTPANNTATENFDGMWDATASAATLNMPDGWRIERQVGAPRMVGPYSAAATEVMYSGGAGLPGNAKNGTWNFGSSAAPTDRAVGGLSTTVDGGTRCVNVMTRLVNGGTIPLNKLTISYDIEKYRKGGNENGFTVQLYYSADGSNWKKAGSDFKTDFAKDDETLGAADVPIATASVGGKQLNTAVAAGGSIYLAWNISVSRGTTPNKAMGLALDNVSLTASFGEPLPEPDGEDPSRPPFVASGIFLRGEVNGWLADSAWEFSDEGNGTYAIYDKELSGNFKIADAKWTSLCNYGSNGSAIMADRPYALVPGTDDNIPCGYIFDCKRILLTIADTGATLMLESKEGGKPGEPPALQSVALLPADVTLVPQLPAKVKVLSLNNSLIHYNDQDFMFNDIARAMDKDAHWTKHTLLGKPLSTHWDEGDGLAADGNPGAKMLIRSEAWSHIILQEQSSLPRTDPEAFRNNVRKWVEYIREHCPNPNAVVIVPMNWAYSGDWTNFTDFNSTLLDNCQDVARETGVTICPVGLAYQQAFDAEGAEGIASWYQDDRHPTDKSTYMAACMEYGLIFGESPATISYHPAAVTDAEAASMRSYAAKALAKFTNYVDHTAATVRFTAVARDQYGNEMEAPADLAYTLTGGGTLGDDHVFRSDKTEGTFKVSAQNSLFSTVATVKVAHAETEVTVLPAIEMNADHLSAAEDFNAMGSDAGARLPLAWRIDRQTTAPRNVGSYAAALDNTMYAGGAALPPNAKNGTWNFGADNGADRAVGGISTGVAGGTRCVNIYAHFMNSGRKDIGKLHISYDVEKYRMGSNPAGFTVQMYHSTDGRNWTSAGNDFCTRLAPDATTGGYDDVPGETIPVSAELDARMQPGVDFFLAWNITVSSGDAANNAMALAIDNFRLCGELPAVPTAKHYIYVIDETGFDALGLYAWGDGELFGAWPGQGWVDEKTIGGDAYKVFLLDADGGTYNLIFNNWNNGRQVADFTVTANRDYYLRVSASGVTELTPAGIAAVGLQPAADGSHAYDLHGRKAGPWGSGRAKGIYIVNGKKYVNK